MKKINWVLLTIFAALLFVSCGNSNENIGKEDLLRDEVFAIHDAVMPRMTEIVELKGKLLELSADSTKALEAKAGISQLEKAEEGMMDWMAKFQQPNKLRETKKHEEIMAYLEGEKQRITKVRDDMNNSIETAQRMLTPVPKAE